MNAFRVTYRGFTIEPALRGARFGYTGSGLYMVIHEKTLQDMTAQIDRLILRTGAFHA